MTCDHSRPYSGAARYLRDRGQLRLVVVCDGCGAVRLVVGELDYRPRARLLVCHLAELTARELGLGQSQLKRVRLAALICDIARAQIPQAILNKRGPLTDEEWVTVHRHPEMGAALLSSASFDDVREWILCYRERPDGHGYPRGLTGEQIPLEARILSVCDAYAAMTCDRPHQAARAHGDACTELLLGAGTQFDATVVDAFLCASPRRSLRLEHAAA
jgi:HD-GYP domain-containing protein (c-di-GMP phosphodiesterase class II)